MNEYLTVWQAFLAMIGVSLACLFYSLGGRSDKWLRRCIGSFILSFTVCGLLFWRGMWTWWALLVFPLLILGFSNGYGADSLWGKVLRRAIYALGVLASGLVFAIYFGGNAWMLFIPHLGIGAWSIFLGVKNPLYAPAEEVMVCAALNLGLVFYPFIVR